MSRPRALIAVVVACVVACALAGGCRRQRPQGSRAAGPPRIETAGVDELVILKPAGRTDAEEADAAPAVRLRRERDEWRLVEPLADRADQAAVANLFDQIEHMQVGRAVTSSPADYARYQVEDARAVRIELRRAGRPVAALLVGEEDAHLRIDGSPQVYELRAFDSLTAARQLRMWRDRAIVRFARPALARIELERDGARYVFQRTPGAAPESWRLVEGGAAVGGPIDPMMPARLADALCQLDAGDFPEGVTAAGAGLAPPRATLTAVLDDGSRHAVLVGAGKGEQVYVKRADGPRIWLAYVAPFLALLGEPARWRDLTVLQVQPRDVVRVELVRGGERIALDRVDAATWKASPPPARLDQGKVRSLLSSLKTIRARAIGRPVDAARLRRPVGSLRVQTRSGDGVTLTIGAEQDGTVAVRREGRPEIYLVSAFTITQLLRAPASFAE